MLSSKLLAPVAVGLALASNAAAQEPLKVLLICDGLQKVTETEVTNMTAQNNQNGQSANAQGFTHRAVEVPRRVSLAFEGETARIRMPRAMLPTFGPKTQDGWLQLSEVQITDRQLAGKVTLNAFNKPTVKIDRTTGDIEIRSLLLAYSGACERGPDDPEARKF